MVKNPLANAGDTVLIRDYGMVADFLQRFPLEWVIKETDWGRSCNVSYDLASEIIRCQFCHILFARSESLTSRKIPHAAEQLSPHATTIEPVLQSPGTTNMEPTGPRVCALQQERPLQLETHASHLESSPHSLQLEKSLLATVKIQHSWILNLKYFKKITMQEEMGNRK